MDRLERYRIYFENIARQLNSVSHTDEDQHFQSIHSSALFNGVQTKIKNVAFFLEDYSSKLTDNDDAFTKTPEGAFSILKQVPGNGNYAAMTAAVSWAEVECNKVIAKIIEDRNNAVDDVKNLDLSSIEFFPLHNSPLGWCGMRVSFSNTIPVGFCYNAADWNADASLNIPNKALSEYTVSELLAGLSETQLTGVLSEQDVRLLEDNTILNLEEDGQEN